MRLGFQPLVSEPCLYAMRDEQNKVRGLAVVYADDVMLSFAPGDEFLTSKHEGVQGIYEWGLWEAADCM